MPLKLPPEAKLIAAKRAALVPRLSIRRAAARAGISETRWRQIESGVIKVKGRDYPETAPADTLASMARAVGVTPDELEAAGRGDAAVYLAALAAIPEDGGHPSATSDQLAEVIARLERLERAVREGNGTRRPA